MLTVEAEFLDIIQTKVERVFLLAIHSHFYSYALRFLFLQTHATTYSFRVLIYTVDEKGENPYRKPYPLLYGLINPYTETSRLKTLKNMPRKKPQRNCMFMNSTADLSLVLLRNR
jgi:hypothetical protein